MTACQGDPQVGAGDDWLGFSVITRTGIRKTYPGHPHGMLTTHADVLNPDLLAFIQS